ncbi:SprT family protein [Fictibacillus sp. Mic-4]|uniref:SprT family protein n=1 Tax=Fictibacillus sp. Mic-4 TaxID=3132826 RepID=UPI003CEC96CA
MQQHELQMLVKNISNECFHKPFRHEARFNKRLRTTGGRYLLSSHDIEINPKQYIEHGMDELIGIIKHELCHYHLHLEGKGYKHKDQDFKRLLKQVGGSRYCKALPSQKKKETYKYLYLCTVCNEKYRRKRRINLARYRCGRCNGPLRQGLLAKTES